MRLAIIGSRSFVDYALVESVMYGCPVTHIISGGAKGADEMGKQYAISMCIPYTIYPANWDEYGKGAGYIRNKQIVDNCDEVLAFWDGESKGTKHSIDYATKMNKKVHIVDIQMGEEHD